MAHLPALAVVSAAQLAAAHRPNERTLDRSLQLDRPTHAPASRTMATLNSAKHHFKSNTAHAIFGTGSDAGMTKSNLETKET